MGRLKRTTSSHSTINESEEEKLNIHVFVDDNGNITQINKTSKDRLKYCIDPYIPQTDIVKSCVIGISDPIEDNCTNGIALGVGDNTYTYAKYE